MYEGKTFKRGIKLNFSTSSSQESNESTNWMLDIKHKDEFSIYVVSSSWKVFKITLKGNIKMS